MSEKKETEHLILMTSMEQNMCFLALREGSFIDKLAYKILHGKPVPEDHIVEILPEHKHPKIEKTTDKPF